MLKHIMLGVIILLGAWANYKLLTSIKENKKLNEKIQQEETEE